MVVWPAEPLPASAASDEEVADVFGQITEELSLARRDAISYTAERLAMAPRQVYEAVERAKRGREGR
jgi:hypothetical protein